jgi:hypothetical protein
MRQKTPRQTLKKLQTAATAIHFSHLLTVNVFYLQHPLVCNFADPIADAEKKRQQPATVNLSGMVAAFFFSKVFFLIICHYVK